MSKQATSTLAKTLERDGLLSHVPHEGDRRAVTYELTALGRVRIAEASADHNARERSWASILTPAEQAAVTGALTKLLDAAHEMDVRSRA